MLGVAAGALTWDNGHAPGGASPSMVTGLGPVILKSPDLLIIRLGLGWQGQSTLMILSKGGRRVRSQRTPKLTGYRTAGNRIADRGRHERNATGTHRNATGAHRNATGTDTADAAPDAATVAAEPTGDAARTRRHRTRIRPARRDDCRATGSGR